MITKFRTQLASLTPTQQLGILGICVISVVLALSCVYVCRYYNTRRKWDGMP